MMTLDNLRSKVIFQNSVDIWIAACAEKKIPWNITQDYNKFIKYLQDKNINLKKYPLCVADSQSSNEQDRQKAKFAESLSENNPDVAYTIKLDDSTLDIIRHFWD